MTVRTWSQDLDSLRATLSRAQRERPQRREFIPIEGGGSELGWVLHEREQMLLAVNTLRAASGKEPVSIEDLLAVESRACGHVDYTTKFAIGCADLVATE